MMKIIYLESNQIMMIYLLNPNILMKKIQICAILKFLDKINLKLKNHK